MGVFSAKLLQYLIIHVHVIIIVYYNYSIRADFMKKLLDV